MRENEVIGWPHRTDSLATDLSKLWEAMKDREVWCAAVCGVVNNRTQLSD